jgi:hypothetical protein
LPANAIKRRYYDESEDEIMPFYVTSHSLPRTDGPHGTRLQAEDKAKEINEVLQSNDLTPDARITEWSEQRRPNVRAEGGQENYKRFPHCVAEQQVERRTAGRTARKAENLAQTKNADQSRRVRTD